MNSIISDSDQNLDNAEDEDFISAKEYIEFIAEELLPKLDTEELSEISKRSSSYSLYLCEIDSE